jgi:hypothetical protein
MRYSTKKVGRSMQQMSKNPPMKPTRKDGMKKRMPMTASMPGWKSPKMVGYGGKKYDP